MEHVSGFFDWFDRRLIQAEDNRDHIKKTLIDSGFLLKGFEPQISYQFYGEAIISFIFVVIDPHKHLKALSIRSDLARIHLVIGNFQYSHPIYYETTLAT